MGTALEQPSLAVDSALRSFCVQEIAALLDELFMTALRLTRQRGDAEHVLDVGSGSGTYAPIAARKVGERGRVYCLDLTDAMLDKQRSNSRKLGVHWMIPIHGNAETFPLPAASVDVVTSNGVLNLVPDKPCAFQDL